MKKISVSIPKPCHENWQQMTPQQKGEYCGVCEKIVIDFSQMSDEELIAFLQKNASKGQKVCGYFSNNQINKPYITHTKLEKHYLHIQKNYRDGWLKSFYLLLLSGLLTLSGCSEQPESTSVKEMNNTDTLFKEAIYYQIPIDSPDTHPKTTKQETKIIINDEENVIPFFMGDISINTDTLTE